MNKTRFLVLAGMVLAAAASQLIPHPPNFTPIAAMALFGGAHFSRKREAFLVPLAAMCLSHLVIGLHSLVPFVYGGFAGIVCLGLWLRRRRTAGRIALAAIAGSVLFFLVTNFGIWAVLDTYPNTPTGLAACYVAGIPYFRNTLLGDLFYNMILFGGFALAQSRFTGLREPQPAAA